MRTLDDLATVRGGDKGDTFILAVFARTAGAYSQLASALCADRIRAHYGLEHGVVVGRVLVPNQRSIVFTLPGLLGEGAASPRRLDGHGKTLSYRALSLEIGDTGDCGCGPPVRAH